jgi:hypothetical protein
MVSEPSVVRVSVPWLEVRPRRRAEIWTRSARPGPVHPHREGRQRQDGTGTTLPVDPMRGHHLARSSALRENDARYIIGAGPGERAASDALSSGCVGLVARADECARVDELLESVRNGLSKALVVRGKAGAGKTALLDYAVGSEGVCGLSATVVVGLPVPLQRGQSVDYYDDPSTHHRHRSLCDAEVAGYERSRGSTEGAGVPWECLDGPRLDESQWTERHGRVPTGWHPGDIADGRGPVESGLDLL